MRLNWRVHMHFPEAVHLGQSDASQLVSVQLLERKISLWLIRQSCSDVQLTELLMQAPSGQLVHHLHCKAGWGGKHARGFASMHCRDSLFTFISNKFVVLVALFLLLTTLCFCFRFHFLFCTNSAL